MSIVVECKSCRKKRKAPARMAGKRVRCQCGGVIAIPKDAPAPVTPSELDISELSMLAEGDRVARMARCPSCTAEMAEDAILCVSCGFNMNTGLRVGDTFESANAEPAEPSGPALHRPKKEPRHKPPPMWIGALVRIVILAVVVAGFSFGAWHVFKAVTFDPIAQMEADILKISPKMHVNDVVKALGGPPRDILTDRDESESDNVVKFLPKKLFWSADFMDKHTKDDLKFGFQFVYKYTERNHLIIWFNPKGEVEMAEKHDPLQMLWGK